MTLPLVSHAEAENVERRGKSTRSARDVYMRELLFPGGQQNRKEAGNADFLRETWTYTYTRCGGGGGTGTTRVASTTFGIAELDDQSSTIVTFDRLRHASRA